MLPSFIGYTPVRPQHLLFQIWHCVIRICFQRGFEAKLLILTTWMFIFSCLVFQPFGPDIELPSIDWLRGGNGPSECAPSEKLWRSSVTSQQITLYLVRFAFSLSTKSGCFPTCTDSKLGLQHQKTLCHRVSETVMLTLKS